ncbi:conserved Plasmodium protein, unknown function [Plasmodium vivax]|nr:conserved Plasmodium protein, unknown function [Plasmodium vivax]
MGFLINDEKQNEVIKTSPAEANREEPTSDIHLGECNNGKKNGEQCAGGNGLVALSGGDTPEREGPAQGSEGYLLANHSSEKEERCDGTPIDILATEEATTNWGGNGGSEREALVGPTEVSDPAGGEGEHSAAQSTDLTEPRVSPPTQQPPCDNGSDVNQPKGQPDSLEPTGEGEMQNFRSGNGDLIDTHDGGVSSAHQGSHSGDACTSVLSLHGPSEQGESRPSDDPNVLISTIEQQKSSFSFQSVLKNPNERAVLTQDGGGSESIPTTNVQASICTADGSASCGGEPGVTVGSPPLESNPLECNGASGMAAEGVGKVNCANGEVSNQGEVPVGVAAPTDGGVTSHPNGGVTGHPNGGVTGHPNGGVTGHPNGEATGHPNGGDPPRRKHPRAAERKTPSCANSDDGDESNQIIKKKIKKRIDENDHLFHAINQFMKEGLKNECIPLFERLQQNLFFLVMLANIPNENFDELESSSSDY